MANRNRTKGHDAERLYAQKFRELGYEFCETSRYASRKHDDCKIDLVGIPFNAQIKAGAQRGMNLSKVLTDMTDAVAGNFPDDANEHKYINFVIWRKDVGKGKKRTQQHDLVTMTWEHFERLINKLADK